MKTFEYNGEEITITQAGYNLYRIEGMETMTYTSDSEIWEGCDDSDNERKEESMYAAYLLLTQ